MTIAPWSKSCFVPRSPESQPISRPQVRSIPSLSAVCWCAVRARSLKRIAALPRHAPVDPDHFQAVTHLAFWQEGNGSWNHAYQFLRHVVRVDDFRSSSGFGAKNLGNPVLLELGFAHLVE